MGCLVTVSEDWMLMDDVVCFFLGKGSLDHQSPILMCNTAHLGISSSTPLCATNVPMFKKSVVNSLGRVLYYCHSNRLRIAEHRQQDQEYVYPC